MARKLRRISFTEATALLNKKIGGKVIQMFKKEDLDDMEDDYFVAVDTGGDATIKVNDGSVFVGPFASPEAAQAAVGDDTEVVDSDAELAVAPPSDDEPPMEAKRRKKVEALRRVVISDILREAGMDSDIDTTIGSASEIDDGGSGNLNTSALGGKVNQSPADAGKQKDTDTGGKDGPHLDGIEGVDKPKVTSGSDTTVTNGADKQFEGLDRGFSPGNMVRVVKKGTQKQVDSGQIEKVEANKLTIAGGTVYEADKYDFIRLG
jgi:hypothetical protein